MNILTGLDWSTFAWLSEQFKVFYDKYTPHTKDGSIFFWMTGTSVSIYLWFGLHILIHVLKNHPDAAIRIPSVDKIREYHNAITENIRVLKQVGVQWMV